LTDEVRSLLFLLLVFLSLTHPDSRSQNSVTWRAISNLLTLGQIPELEALDEGKRAAVLFGRVHGIGPARAKEL
jgi:hypothetical protein